MLSTLMNSSRLQGRTRLLGCAAALPLLLAAGLAPAPVVADVLPGNLLIGTSGDGLIFNDPEEGVLAPGIKSVTFTSTRDPLLSDVFLPPYENIIVDYTDVVGDGDLTDDPLENRGSAPNCLMANNPTVYCDSASGSGKRIKTWLTGPTAFDMRIRTSPTYINQAGEAVDVSSVEYFNFGKVSNFTGARITGMSIELLAADGTPMGTLDPSSAVLFELDPAVIANLGNGARLVDGLFGEGATKVVSASSTETEPVSASCAPKTLWTSAQRRTCCPTRSTSPTSARHSLTTA